MCGYICFTNKKLASTSLKLVVMDTYAWAIWGLGSCWHSFNVVLLDYYRCLNKALEYNFDQFQGKEIIIRKYCLTQFAISVTSISDAIWTSKISPCGLEFVVIANFKHIVIVDSMATRFDSSLHTEATTLLKELKFCFKGG